MTLNGEMAIILRYFAEFVNGPYFALFHQIRVRCRCKTIVRLTSISNLCVFSERELKFNFAICYRPSVCQLLSRL